MEADRIHIHPTSKKIVKGLFKELIMHVFKGKDMRKGETRKRNYPILVVGNSYCLGENPYTLEKGRSHKDQNLYGFCMETCVINHRESQAWALQ